MLFEICRQEPSASFKPLYLNAVLIRPSCRVGFLFECFDVFVSCAKLVFEVSFFFMGFVVLAGGLLVIIIAVIVAVVSSVSAAVAADQDVED